MMETLSSKGSLSVRDVQNLIRLVTSSNGKSNGEHHTPDLVIHYGKKGAIVPKTNGQENYVKTVYKNDVVFCIGPAGTGKTFLAVALAVAALENNEVDRIILCRPAVEAGEHLGFLPGDLKEKVDPYLAPLYDSLRIIFPENKLAQLLERNSIEVVPLAYMRGRTLDSAYMILDEAQNATALQMKMFLTRLGIGSQAIVTGDITQIDLQKRSDSGLIQVTNILNNVEGIGFITLGLSDVVRHSLVMKIIQAYDEKLKNEDSSK
jgi:phosphate starvation-inducible PhoH-like protein